MNNNFYLLLPEELAASYQLSESVKHKLVDYLSLLSQPSTSNSYIEKDINYLWQSLETEEFQANGGFDSHVYDEYFRIKRIQSESIPKCLKLAVSVVMAKKVFEELNNQCLSSSTPLISPLECWKRSHWVFITLIQGLIVCFLRFESQMNAGNFKEAGIELETASALMVGSAVAMEMAGSFNTQNYLAEVRYTMPDRFSGIMMQDHCFLIAIWKKLHPIFISLPDVLKPQHELFTASYKKLATGHKAVCEKFGGKEEGSLLSPQCKATDMLTRFEGNRLRMLNGKNGCPMGKDLLSLDNNESMIHSFRSYGDLLMRVFELPEFDCSQHFAVNELSNCQLG